MRGHSLTFLNLLLSTGAGPLSGLQKPHRQKGLNLIFKLNNMLESSFIAYLYITLNKCATERSHRKKNLFWLIKESVYHDRDGMAGRSGDMMREKAKHKMGSS